MSKKHFIQIAKAIKDQKSAIEGFSNSFSKLETLKVTVDNLAFVFSGINPNFDRSEFRRACGF
jgi:hypothetical protein